MLQLAEDVQQLAGKPKNLINIYLIEGVLVDAGTPGAYRRIFRELGDETPTAHLVTHAHPDHFGSSAKVCAKYDIPLLCGEVDADRVERGKPEAAPTFLAQNVLARMPMPHGHPVDRRLKEGDMVGNFRVINAFGHSRGHIVLWRERDRTLVIGDVAFNLNPLTMKVGLMEPPKILTLNPAQNRDSARKLVELEPALILFGHGPALRDTEEFTRWVESLPG